MFLFEQFDANQDGRLTQAEIDQVRQSRLAEFDQNGDGKLTLEEYQALWMAAMRERMVDRFQSHDDDGDGLVTVEEFAEPFDRVIVRFDRNGDGELTLDEVRRRGGRDGDARPRRATATASRVAIRNSGDASPAASGAWSKVPGAAGL